MSKEVKTGGPAFPVELSAMGSDIDGFANDVILSGHTATYGGMTLRDYFAAKAMQGLASKPGSPDYEYEAMAAYKYADAMLAEREKQK